MGNWVTVEALRQIKISANKPPISKLGAVVLAAPDIDIDVFKSEMRRFGKPRKPFFSSSCLTTIRHSGFLILSRAAKSVSERTPTMGELTALGAVVIDMTSVKADDPSNHAKFAQLAEIAPSLRQVLEGGVAAPEQSVKGQVTSASVIEGLGAPIRIIRAGQ